MTTLGAIRLESFNGVNGPGAQKGFGDANLNWISDAAYTSSCPYWLDVSNPAAVTGRSDTQAFCDRDIEMAWRSGIDYFAYDFGASEYQFFAAGIGHNPAVDTIAEVLLGINRGLTLHLSSSQKTLVKACVVLNAASYLLPTTGSDASFGTYVKPYLVSLFQDSAYMTVLSGRPLVFLFDPTGSCDGTAYRFSTSTALANAIQALRDACAAASGPSVGNPYIVGLYGGGDISAINATLGLDAGGAYSLGGASGAAQTAASWISDVETNWTALKGYFGTAWVPSCSVGADHRRIYRSIGGFRAYNRAQTVQIYNYANDNYSLAPSNEQWAAHVVAGKAEALAHSDADTLLLNGWIEGDCWPPIVPTVGNPGEYLQYMAQAIGRQRENSRTLRNRGFQLLSR